MPIIAALMLIIVGIGLSDVVKAIDRNTDAQKICRSTDADRH